MAAEKMKESKFQVGDRVRCIGKDGGAGSNSDHHSAGWKSGYEFVVARISSGGLGVLVYWPEGGGNGVFEDHLELCSDVEAYFALLKQEVEQGKPDG